MTPLAFLLVLASDFPATSYAQIALHTLCIDQLLQRGDTVPDPRQWPDSRIL